MSVIAVPNEALGARLNDTVTEGNCPWWLMERASVMGEAFVNAPRGIAFALVAVVPVFGVVPAKVPPFCDEVPEDVIPPTAEAGAVNTDDDGVYLTEEVRALEPAAADADAENELAAAAPLAPEEALD